MLVPKCGRFTLIITDSLDYQKLELYSIILPHSRIYDIIEHPQSHGLYCRLTCQKKKTGNGMANLIFSNWLDLEPIAMQDNSHSCEGFFNHIVWNRKKQHIHKWYLLLVAWIKCPKRRKVPFVCLTSFDHKLDQRTGSTFKHFQNGYIVGD